MAFVEDLRAFIFAICPFLHKSYSFLSYTVAKKKIEKSTKEWSKLSNLFYLVLFIKVGNTVNKSTNWKNKNLKYFSNLQKNPLFLATDEMNKIFILHLFTICHIKLCICVYLTKIYYTQCGNARIFLPFRFFMKLQNCHYWELKL